MSKIIRILIIKLICLIVILANQYPVHSAFFMIPNPTHPRDANDYFADLRDYFPFQLLQIIGYYKNNVVPYWSKPGCERVIPVVIRDSGNLDKLKRGEGLFIFGIGGRGVLHDYMGRNDAGNLIGGYNWTGEKLIKKFADGELYNSPAVKVGHSIKISFVSCLSATKADDGGSLILDTLYHWNQHRSFRDIKPMAVNITGIDGYAVLDQSSPDYYPFVVIPWDKDKVSEQKAKKIISNYGNKMIDQISINAYERYFGGQEETLLKDELYFLNAASIVAGDKLSRRGNQRYIEALYLTRDLLRRDPQRFITIMMIKKEDGSVTYHKGYTKRYGWKQYSTFEELKNDYP